MEVAERWRLFVALEIPGGMGRYLAAQQAGLREHLPGDHVRWVRPEGIHFTLRFLGSVAPTAVPAISAAIRRVAATHGAQRLRPAGLGSFGRQKQMKAIWVGIDGNEDRLAGLVRDLNGALGEAGFAGEERPFRAHLTLGRVRERSAPAIRSALHGEMGRYRLPPAEAVDLVAIQLIRSHLGKGGARYEVLQSFRLAASEVS